MKVLDFNKAKEEKDFLQKRADLIEKIKRAKAKVEAKRKEDKLLMDLFFNGKIEVPNSHLTPVK